jgi:hypothetical protein
MWAGVVARLLRASALADRAFRKFEAARHELVLSLASDEVLAKYGDLAYAATDSYHPSSERYRRDLFTWEAEVIARFFPAPPASILIGAAGGGREAFALAEQGYAILAFEPSRLVEGMADRLGPWGRAAGAGRRHRGAGEVEVCRGRYADMPVLKRLDGTAVDISAGPAFDAGIIGWGSFSHLVTDGERLQALRAFAAVVAGPVLLSFFGRIVPSGPPPRPTGLRRLLLAAKGDRRPGCMFSVDVGVYRQLTADDVRSLAREARVDLLHLDMKAEWPHAIVRRADAA